jgi:hypothetical protein
MAPDPIERKLSQIILPYLISAERLQRYTLYKTYGYYSLLNAYIAALVGFGLAPPLMKWYLELTGPGTNAKVPTNVGWVALLLGFILVAVSVYYRNENVSTRYVLARTCRAELLDVSDELHTALQSSNPQSEIVVLQNKTVSIIKRYRTQHQSWPWDRFAPEIEQDVQRRVSDLKSQFGPWKLTSDREERVKITVRPSSSVINSDDEETVPAAQNGDDRDEQA